MYIYVDYIQIHTITLDNDVLCMDGAYQDPITAKLKFTYFEADFNYFYNFLTENDFDNTDFALEALAGTLTDKAPCWIDLHDKFIQLHTMVFRLTILVDQHDDTKEVGLFIEDGYVLEEGCFSFQQHLQPPSFEGNDRAQKVKILRAYKNMSGHLAALALRYAYYGCKIREGTPQHLARSQASLQDVGLFLASKSALNFINLGPATYIEG